MGLLFKKYKTKFRYALKPVFAMLVARKKELPVKEWVALVNRSRGNILNNVQEYLGTDLPEQSLITDVLDEIFQEFLKEGAYHASVVAQLNTVTPRWNLCHA